LTDRDNSNREEIAAEHAEEGEALRCWTKPELRRFRAGDASAATSGSVDGVALS
jgi:hypothetical protein